MAEGPTTPAGPDVIARPPVIFIIAGLTGLIALATSAVLSATPGWLHYVAALPLLLGIVLWAVAALRFAQWGAEVRHAREVQAAVVAGDPHPGRRYSPRA